MMGARIAALRRDAGWSQAELGKRLQVSASAVGMYEQGRREPSADTLVALARELQVTTDFLLTGKISTIMDDSSFSRMLTHLVNTAERKLEYDRDKPFSRQELAVLFAALLME